MRIATVCPYCGATLEQPREAVVEALRACWRCLRPIIVLQAAREPNAAELANIDHEQLNAIRKLALDFRESIRE